MLFEFHRKQNAKKPGSVHATYLIIGTRTEQKPQEQNGVQSQDSEDAVMQSSPPLPSSSAPQQQEEETKPTPVRSILLVKEEHLDQAKATFDHITGIHVYSLAAGGLSDVQTLTECNRKIAATYASEDPLEAWKQYGTIQNPNVRRRTQKRPPPAPAASTAKETAAKPKPAPAPANAPALEKQATKASNESDPNSSRATPVPEKDTDATKKKIATKPTTKRENSDIFKSFAKGANKPKKTASTESSAAPSPAPAPAEDEPMGGMSDDDPEDAADDVEVEAGAGTGKSKKDRQAELEAMMDVEDEPMEDIVEGASDEPMEPPKEESVEEEQKEEEPKESMTVENGRRRGRRRVMKKKTVKDEEGYLGKPIALLLPWQSTLC